MVVGGSVQSPFPNLGRDLQRMDLRISEAEAREYAAMTWALAARAEAAGNIKLAKELVERARKADELWARYTTTPGQEVN